MREIVTPAGTEPLRAPSQEGFQDRTRLIANIIVDAYVYVAKYNLPIRRQFRSATDIASRLLMALFFSHRLSPCQTPIRTMNRFHGFIPRLPSDLVNC